MTSTKQTLCGAGVILLLFTMAAVIDTYPLAALFCVLGMAGCAIAGELKEVHVDDKDPSA